MTEKGNFHVSYFKISVVTGNIRKQVKHLKFFFCILINGPFQYDIILRGEVLKGVLQDTSAMIITGMLLNMSEL